MAQRTRKASWVKHMLLVITLAGVPTLAGCGKQPAAQDQGDASAPAGQQKAGTASPGKAGPDNGASPGGTPAQPAIPTTLERDLLHQSFADATREGEEPPPTSVVPPDVTLAGKSVYAILKQVREQWDSIRFTSASGKRIEYTAQIDTELGAVELKFFPEAAPNHVRNFIALARAGYYDGLLFERIGHEETVAVDGQTLVLDQVQAGCPRGSGELGHGHIGYWLRPEVSDKVSHEEGTLGACRAIEADTAACRFYITLNRAPFLDGHYTIFARVTRGLDVVRKIHQQPVAAEDEDRDGARKPQKPVVIRKVVIQEQETNTSQSH